MIPYYVYSLHLQIECSSFFFIRIKYILPIKHIKNTWQEYNSQFITNIQYCHSNTSIIYTYQYHYIVS
jgi:hypothetical protein